MENALLGISVDKESPGESPGVVQVRGDDNMRNIILLGCSVKGEKWWRGDTTVSLKAA